MKYFKAFRGYGDDFISVRETELERVFYAQITGEMFVGSGGSVDGSKIQMVRPDYHKTMGWNYAYVIDPDDWAQINREHGNLESVLFVAGKRAKYFAEIGDSKHQLDTGIALPPEILLEPAQKFSDEVKRIADAKKISP